jgi:hypothetical protein
MTPRLRLAHGIIYGAIFLTAAIPLARELFRRDDIWWTPFAMRLPLAQTADRVEIYVKDRPLLPLLESGKIRVADGSPSVVAASDVGLRFNNRDRVRSEKMTSLLWDAALCGAVGSYLFVLAIGGVEMKKERPPNGV